MRTLKRVLGSAPLLLSAVLLGPVIGVTGDVIAASGDHALGVPLCAGGFAVAIAALLLNFLAPGDDAPPKMR